MLDQRIVRRDYHLTELHRAHALARVVCEQPWVSAARTATARLLTRFFTTANLADPDIPGLLRDFCLQHPREMDDQGLPEQTVRNLYVALQDSEERASLDTEERIIGLALGDMLIARGQFTADIVAVARLSARNPLRRAGIADATHALLQASDSALLEAMAALVDYENRFQRSPAYYAHEERNRALAGWLEETDPVHVWQGHGWSMSCLIPEVVALLDILRTPCPALFVELHERLQFPSLAKQLMYFSDIAHDFECLSLLLEKAPVVFDDAGHWNHKTMALQLLEVAFRHLQTLAVPQNREEAPLADLAEVTAKARSIMAVLLARADGRVIAQHWMRHRLSRLRDRHVDPFEDAMIEACVAELVRDEFPLQQLLTLETEPPAISLAAITALERASDETQRAYYHFFIALLLTREQPDAADLRATFEKLLIEARSEFKPTRNYRSHWQHALVGELYLDAGHPSVERWRGTFERFASLCRNARHGSRAKDLGAPSLFMAGVAVAMLRKGLAQDVTAESATRWAPLWDAIFEAAFCAYACSASDKDWAGILDDLFGFYPRIRKAVGDAQQAPPPIQVIARLGGDERLLTHAVLIWGLHGMDLTDITSDVGQQSELANRITAYIDWSIKYEAKPVPPSLRGYWHTRQQRQRARATAT
ncbi:hypothetical protein P0Y43_15745 [Pseudomonas entomophila]|uniref:hypothetical protein n=1 Tax=Pseudomonas entomophila TaxID=312306 RepID=UPI0023D8C064|nr:hypothetical protein [Pseudomonas entomophila]MDF0732170.1 hypothetical protein [Pseudomonas entomophila]